MNLSKSGLGVSGGVTGARIGLGPKGAYVHGGRHGLYYRKYAPASRQSTELSKPGETRYFVDTGYTYKQFAGIPERKALLPPKLKGHSKPAMILLGAGLLLALLFFAAGEGMYVIAGMLSLTGGIILNSRHLKYRETAQKTRKDIEQAIEEKSSVPELIAKHKNAELGHAYRQWLDFNVFALLQDAFYSDPEYILPEELESVEKYITLSQQELRTIKADAFAAFLEDLMADHMISKDEEQRLDFIQSSLRINDDDIAWEKHTISQMCAFRDALEMPLEQLEVDIPLKRNETCYYRCEGRLLREKIMVQYQRHGVVYKEIGYDIDMEGTIYLCSGRILIVGRGSRSYSLNRILDVTLSQEDHTVQLILDDRKNPLIISTKDIATFAGKLEKMISAQK